MAARKSRPTFSIEDIAVTPAPGMKIPGSFAFSKDDRLLTYLAGTGTPPVQSLHALDTGTGAVSLLVTPPGGGMREETLSPEEELLRQRERSLNLGLTRYSLAQNSERILVPLNGDIYVQDSSGAPLRQIFDHAGGAPALTPALSPDGSQVAYVREGEVYVISAEGGEPRQLTHGAREAGVAHGVAEYVAQEELDRREGFWWSPDGRWLAFTEMDERHIPIYRIMHQGKDVTGEEAQEDHRYPFAGKPNAIVRLAVVPAAGGEPVWLDFNTSTDDYLARMFWWKDGSPGAIWLNRAQTVAEVLRFDLQSGKRKTVLREESHPWFNLPRRALALLADDSFIWPSERSGFRHLYLYDRKGKLVRQLTSGEWPVDAIAGVDECDKQVYFTAGRETPTESHLYAAPLGGGDPRRVTQEPGMHDVTLDHGCHRFVDVYSALDRPPTITLRSLADGMVLHTVHTPDDPRLTAFKLEPPELVTLRNHEGTLLHGAIYRPPVSFGPGPHPTIVSVYGGPHAQTVTNSWSLTAALQLQYLRSLGYLIFRLDNRGSARRGLAFESAIARHMGTVEVDDQVDGVRWLVDQGLTDPERVGITGWSYGGYMTLMCLAKAPDTFSVGVAGAPTTAMDGYDTAYTERYMGTPQSNPEGYAVSSVLSYADQMRGKLLIVHGMLDENVHFRHTARLINALTRARRQYDLVIFPDERHMPRHLPDRIYQHERIVGYFTQHLTRQ